MNTSTTAATKVLPLDDASYWIATKDGKLEYVGPGEIIRIHGLRHACIAAFADGYRHALRIVHQQEREEPYLPTDYELTALINQHLPATVPVAQIEEWRRGFVLGQVIAWEAHDSDLVDNGIGE